MARSNVTLEIATVHTSILVFLHVSNYRKTKTKEKGKRRRGSGDVGGGTGKGANLADEAGVARPCPTGRQAVVCFA